MLSSSIHVQNLYKSIHKMNVPNFYWEGGYLCSSPFFEKILPPPRSLVTLRGHEACTNLYSFENKNLFPSGAPKDTAGESSRCVLNTWTNLKNDHHLLDANMISCFGPCVHLIYTLVHNQIKDWEIECCPYLYWKESHNFSLKWSKQIFKIKIESFMSFKYLCILNTEHVDSLSNTTLRTTWKYRP